MRINKIISSILCILSLCCCIPKDYEKFQTFDEYSLKGVKPVDKLRKPYVAVKTEKDTIKVLIVEDIWNKKLVEYVNRGDYWYNTDKRQYKYNPRCWCDTTPCYLETYIFKDTIIAYSYCIKNDKNKSFEYLDIKTKNSELSLYDKNGFNGYKTDNFYELKLIIENYKDSFENENYSQPQKKVYHLLNKKIIGNTLYYYEARQNDIAKNGDIFSKNILGSLGEYQYRLDYKVNK